MEQLDCCYLTQIDPPPNFFENSSVLLEPHVPKLSHLMSLEEQDPCGRHITKRGIEEIFETDLVGVVECVPQHQVMHPAWNEAASVANPLIFSQEVASEF